jgi:hypothetical protein
LTDDSKVESVRRLLAGPESASSQLLCIDAHPGCADAVRASNGLSVGIETDRRLDLRCPQQLHYALSDGLDVVGVKTGNLGHAASGVARYAATSESCAGG